MEALKLSQRSGVKHCKNAGIAEAIRRVLRGGPLGIAQIAMRIRKSETAVRDSISKTVVRQGGIYPIGPQNNKKYSLTPPRTEKTPSCHVAGRITIGRGSRWGASLV